MKNIFFYKYYYYLATFSSVPCVVNIYISTCKIRLICGQWKLQPVSNILLTDTWPFARKLSTLWLHTYYTTSCFSPMLLRDNKNTFDPLTIARTKNRTKHLKSRRKRLSSLENNTNKKRPNLQLHTSHTSEMQDLNSLGPQSLLARKLDLNT